ncbi:hypothetical protein jhhlp_003182, partial [Lomentospora prolificans]
SQLGTQMSPLHVDNMWPLTSLSRMSGRNAVTLFEIRLDNDFIVFRGNGHESAGQLLKGQVVLCLSGPLKLEELHLRLSGTLRLSWTQAKMTATGVSQQKVDKTVPILQHRWKPFAGGVGKSVVLQPGNYEFPFEYMLPGDTSETLEGIPEASISYRLKARIMRHRLASDIHTYKHLRVIRTLEPSALEFLHAMSVENIWPNKVDYSLVIPQKAVVFGGSVPVQMRFTPLLKGLGMGAITAKLIECRECAVQGPTAGKPKEFKSEREVGQWKFEVERQHWHDTIGETGQEGWVLEKKLDLPKKLRQCVQDMNQHGIKVRHKLRLVVSLKNPDGHVSELRATLPVSIFISPNIPLDEEGNLVMQSPDDTVPPLTDPETIAPPGYGQHLLDRLYDDVVFGGFQTPENQSGANSPYYHPSAAASSESLAQAAEAGTDTTIVEALATRLQSVSGAYRSRRNSVLSTISEPPEEISRLPSNEHPLSGRTSPEHLDDGLLEELNKVPSYATAVRTPARPRSYIGGPSALPMYDDIEPEVSSPEETTPDPESQDADAHDTNVSSEPNSPATRHSSIFRAARSESLSSQGSQRPQTSAGEEPQQPRTTRPRPLSGLSESLLQRLSNHSYGYYGYGLDPRPHQGARPTMQCM